MGSFDRLLFVVGHLWGDTPEEFGNASLVVAEGDFVFTGRLPDALPATDGRRVAVLNVCRSVCTLVFPSVEEFMFSDRRGRVVLRNAEVGDAILDLEPRGEDMTGRACLPRFSSATREHVVEVRLTAQDGGVIIPSKARGVIGTASPGEEPMTCDLTARDVEGRVRISWQAQPLGQLLP